MLGKPKKTSSQDQSDVVFEPQDCDKGDIARACFYMVACYNNLSGTDTITQFNPNLTFADYATSNGDSEASSATHPVAMGILSDLLEWNRIDPVDDYETHRNNLIYKNYQHNRNPFVDFPQWAEYIWGTQIGSEINPAGDAINDSGIAIALSSKTIKVDQTFQISATTSDASAITWTVADNTVASISKTKSASGEQITVTGLKEGETNITATATVGGNELSKICKVIVSNSSGGGEEKSSEETPEIPWLYIIIGAVVLVIIIIIIIAVPSARKKAKKAVKKTVKKQVKKSTKKK